MLKVSEKFRAAGGLLVFICPFSDGPCVSESGLIPCIEETDLVVGYSIMCLPVNLGVENRELCAGGSEGRWRADLVAPHESTTAQLSAYRGCRPWTESSASIQNS